MSVKLRFSFSIHFFHRNVSRNHLIHLLKFTTLHTAKTCCEKLLLMKHSEREREEGEGEGERKRERGVCFNITLQSRLRPPDVPVQTEMPQTHHSCPQPTSSKTAAPTQRAPLFQKPPPPLTQPNPTPSLPIPIKPLQSHHVAPLNPAEETDSAGHTGVKIPLRSRKTVSWFILSAHALIGGARCEEPCPKCHTDPHPFLLYVLHRMT